MALPAHPGRQGAGILWGDSLSAPLCRLHMHPPSATPAWVRLLEALQARNAAVSSQRSYWIPGSWNLRMVYPYSDT
jgi:hypothetical protein